VKTDDDTVWVDLFKEEAIMHRQVAWALAHPVFDPERQITGGHFWQAKTRISAGLTVNIGME
jgi:hypothetical protein